MTKKNMLKIIGICIVIYLILYNIIISNVSNSTLREALTDELFTTIHMSVFVFLPLSFYLAHDGSEAKANFICLSIIRIIILLIFDIFITTNISYYDFIFVFIGGIISCILFYKKSLTNEYPFDNINITNNLKCPYCHNPIKVEDNFCTSCGKEIPTTNIPIIKENIITISSFDSLYDNSDNDILEEFINKELKNANIAEDTDLIPSSVLKKKKTMIFIFSLLLFVFMCSIFFHFPLLFYIVYIILLVLIYYITNHYNLIKYIKKEIKSRPQEKMSNIIMSIKNSFVKDDSRASFLGCAIVAVAAPMMLFFTPRIMYEQDANGYYVRFYTSGVINNKTAIIPDTYKGKPVIGLRGNTFSNMPFLEYVYLPDTITEIRGQAFKNDKRLKEVKLPANLTYLGGGAFYNCIAITSIELPDTLTFLGGESFKNARSLKYIKLSNQLTEIRGNTFENCTSLTSIDIPDTVTRIGGHAFYGCTSLSTVNISVNSQLLTIGSSAFRKCTSLRTINLPKGTSVNSRSFKESPTTINYYDINQIVSKDALKKNETFYFSTLNEEKEINKTDSSYNTYKTKIRISDVLKDLIYYTYSIEVEIDGNIQTFALSYQKPYAIVNNNLVIYMENKTDFISYEDGIIIKAYYN